MRRLEQEGYPRQNLVLSKSRSKFGNVYECVTLYPLILEQSIIYENTHLEQTFKNM